MTIPGTESKYNDITELIIAERLGDAVRELKSFITPGRDWEADSMLYDIETSYSYMKEYMKNNMKDDTRQDMYRMLLSKAVTLNDRIRFAALRDTSPQLYFDKSRYYARAGFKSWEELTQTFDDTTKNIAMCNLMNNTEEKARLNKLFAETYTEAFYKIWTNRQWDNAEEAQARQAFGSNMPDNVLAALTSALSMSLMQCFDQKKLLLLTDLCTAASRQVKARAAAGLIFVLKKYDRLLKLFPQVTDKLNLMQDDASFRTLLDTVAMQFLKSFETKRINKKMHDEIIPEMMKTQKNLFKNRNAIDFNIIDESTLNEMNPEWQKEMEKSGLEKKLKEMNELQMEGADIYMGTFAQLKSFPFFFEMANWFYPFDASHPEVEKSIRGTGQAFMEMITQSPFFCNSDKYSMCLMMSQVPDSQKQLMMQQFDGQNEAIRMLKEEYKNADDTTVSNQYIQDLYRFFKLFNRKNEFEDIFEQGIALLDTAWTETAADTAQKTKIADYLFKNEHFADALKYYRQNNAPTGGIFQKMGFCEQKLGNYRNAMQYYEKADLLQPDNTWTLKHLAMCYIVANDIDKAIDIYTRLGSKDSDNTDLLLQTGKCLLRKEQYEEAMKYLYKANFLKPDHIPVTRTIAWALVNTGEAEKAVTFYDKIPDKDRTQNDCFNAGHALWISGNIARAIDMYRKGTAMSDKNIFYSVMDEDSRLLARHGITATDIAIMKDIVAND